MTLHAKIYNRTLETFDCSSSIVKISLFKHIGTHLISSKTRPVYCVQSNLNAADQGTYAYFIIFFLFFMIRKLLLKTFFPVSRILIMKTTVSYFLGIFENPAPAVKTCCKLNIIFLNKSKIL